LNLSNKEFDFASPKFPFASQAVSSRFPSESSPRGVIDAGVFSVTLLTTNAASLSFIVPVLTSSSPLYIIAS